MTLGKALTVPERCCCYAWRAVIEVVVKGLIERNPAGHLALTDRGRDVVRAMLPDL
jgi:hypothetical protein